MAEADQLFCFHKAINELPAWRSYQMLGELSIHHNEKIFNRPLKCFPVSRIKIQSQ